MTFFLSLLGRPHSIPLCWFCWHRMQISNLSLSILISSNTIKTRLNWSNSEVCKIKSNALPGFHIGKPLKISKLVDLTTKKLVMNLSGGASVLASPNQSSTAQLIGCVFPSIRLQFLNWMCWELFFLVWIDSIPYLKAAEQDKTELAQQNWRRKIFSIFGTLLSDLEIMRYLGIMIFIRIVNWQNRVKKVGNTGSILPEHQWLLTISSNSSGFNGSIFDFPIEKPIASYCITS